MENKASQIKVVNMSGGYILPKVTETKGRKKHVEMGIEGADDFFTTLIKRYETSPTNQACIDGSTDLILGKGVKAKGNQMLEDYLYSITNEDEIRKIVFDYKMFGNAAIQCVFNEDRSKIVSFYHLPVDTLRAAKVDEQGNIPGYYYSSDWTDTKIKPAFVVPVNLALMLFSIKYCSSTGGKPLLKFKIVEGMKLFRILLICKLLTSSSTAAYCILE